MKHTKGVTTLAQFDYTLNNVGNRTTKNATGSIPNRNESYTYDQRSRTASRDAIDQVTGTTATGTNPNTQTFASDGAGNRTSVGATNAAPGTGTYTTNALNQYTALGAEVLLYDINGNLTTQGLSASYSYDSKNRLIGATKGTETMSATYDYQNRQVSRTMNNGVSYFIYDGWNLIGEYTANGSMWQKHIHGAATDEILAKTDWAGTFYYHSDGLGSTVALTNSSGNVIESYLYDVYGKPTVLNASNTVITASAFGNRFLFTGREWIRRIGIYDYRNRVYSPDLGRFLQTDPIRFDAGDLNIYRYVGNNAVNWVDPSGLTCVTYDHGVTDQKTSVTQSWYETTRAEVMTQIGYTIVEIKWKYTEAYWLKIRKITTICWDACGNQTSSSDESTTEGGEFRPDKKERIWAKTWFIPNIFYNYTRGLFGQ